MSAGVVDEPGMHGVKLHFHIVADAGGANQAVVKEFAASTDNNGEFHIQFTGVIDQAQCSGIEILSNSSSVKYGKAQGRARNLPTALSQPLRMKELLSAVRRYGWKIYDLEGKRKNVFSIAGRGIYLIETEGKLSKRIILN
jgi:hypothetical protein